MAQPLICEECRAIARELAEAYAEALKASPDRQTLEARLDARQAIFRALTAQDAGPSEDAPPTVAPEILDINNWQRLPDVSQLTGWNPLARAFYRKIKHEGRTGHKIKFPPRG